MATPRLGKRSPALATAGALLAVVAATTTSGTAQDEATLRRHFGEQQFAPPGGFVLRVGAELPELRWERPQLVTRVVDAPAIPTRWFDEQFHEVKTATRPGRYYVYGEAPAPDGPPLRRAMTCYCVKRELDLAALAKRVAAAEEAEATGEGDSLLRDWQSTEAGAVRLAGFVETGNARPPRPGQWQMENATKQVLLKRKLLQLDDQPLIRVTPKKLSGPPAPTLRRGPLNRTGVAPRQVEELEARLDAWYRDSQEPMAVVVARRGVIVTSRAYGQVDGKDVTIHTPMLLHSAMKPLIGLQLATYVDRGHLQLDEPIGNYLSDFRGPQDQLLTFRAGHVHATGILFPWELAFRRLFYFHTWHESLIAHCPREWAPGDRRRYGVVGVILSVRALELLRGRNYWDAMERDLFHPLGIRDTYPGGTGFSAENMARIGVLLDNRGKYGPWEVISEQTHAAILPAPLQPHFPKLDMTYGIGLQRSNSLGPGSYGHGGGCGTLLAVHPPKHLVFAMVRNAQGKDFKRHRGEVLSLVRSWNVEK